MGHVDIIGIDNEKMYENEKNENEDGKGKELDRAGRDNASGKISGAQNDDKNPIPLITISSEDKKTEKVDKDYI